MAGRPVFRFAPSPNGELHLGHALSALTGWELARRMGGRFLLRIEDIDTARTRTDFIAQIFDDLAWLGISWEEPVLRQSEHLTDYQAAAAALDRLGLLYPCFATRSEIAAAARRQPMGVDPDGAPLMLRRAHGLPDEIVAQRREEGAPFALRIDMRRALDCLHRQRRSQMSYRSFDAEGSEQTVIARPERWGDAVIVRKDIPASYHLAVVVDDARQGVTHVTRGLDLLYATDLHRLLQVLLGLPEPTYHHHRLITDREGRKLSKSARDTSLRSLRAAGATARDIRAAVGLT